MGAVLRRTDFDAVLTARLPTENGGPLRSMDTSVAWLGTLGTADITAAASFTGNRLQAAWLPNAGIAAKWREFVQTGTVIDSVLPPPRIVNPTRDAGGLVTLKWEAQCGTNSLFQSFTIYKNGALLGFAPGVAIGYGDEPGIPATFMTFTTTKAVVDHSSLQVSARNYASLDSEKSAPVWADSIAIATVVHSPKPGPGRCDRAKGNLVCNTQGRRLSPELGSPTTARRAVDRVRRLEGVRAPETQQRGGGAWDVVSRATTNQSLDVRGVLLSSTWQAGASAHAVDPITGRFSCELRAGSSMLRSRGATLSVYPDTTPPRVLGIFPHGGNLTLMYSERVNSAAGAKETYTISPNVSVTGAGFEKNVYRVSYNGNIAWPDTAVYTMKIKGVTDISSRHNLVSPNPLVIQFNGYGIVDKVPPLPPTGITVVAVTSQSVVLSWSPSVDNVLMKGYQIARNGVVVGTELNSLLSYLDTGLTSNTQYEYTIKALDGAGNLSAASAPTRITTANSLFSILSPKAGQSYAVGSKLSIRYRVDRAHFSGELAFALSPDNGKQWVELLDQGFIPSGDTGTIVWTIADSVRGVASVSTACKLKLYDYARTLDPFVMEGVFTIGKAPSAATPPIDNNRLELRLSRTDGHAFAYVPATGHYRLRIYSLDGSCTLSALLDGKKYHRLTLPRSVSGLQLAMIFDSRGSFVGRTLLWKVR